MTTVIIVLNKKQALKKKKVWKAYLNGSIAFLLPDLITDLTIPNEQGKT